MDETKLNWASASVEGAKLTVPLDGELPAGWKETFEKTVRLLGSGEWGAVELKKQSVRVGEVQPGNEDKLRHYLESVVEQANAAQRAEQEEATRSDEEPSRDGPDAEMTDRFRAFAESDESGESDE